MNQFEQIQNDQQQQMQQQQQQQQMQQQMQQQQQQKSSNGKKTSSLIILLLLLMMVSIGYAALSSSLNISGTSTIQETTWSIDSDDSDIECPSGVKCTVGPDNPETVTPDDGVPTPTNPDPVGAVIWMDGNTVYFKHVLTQPGDVFTFTTTFTNNGTIDAKVSNVTTSSLNATAQRFMTYTVTYADGTEIKTNDLLAAGESATFKVTVAYKRDISALPTAAELALINETADGHTGATSLFTVTYEQA